MTPDELERHGYPRDLHTRPGALQEWRNGPVPTSNGTDDQIGAKPDADPDSPVVKCCWDNCPGRAPSDDWDFIDNDPEYWEHAQCNRDPDCAPQPGVSQPGDKPYTPSTEQVRAAYVRAMRNAFIASAGEHEIEFDRWLENLIAEVVQDVRHE